MLRAGSGWRRASRAGVVALTAAAVATSGASCTSHQSRQGAAFCAIMPDSVGLYEGNPVTQMGYQIGTVTTITPAARDVRVEFNLADARSVTC